jgi:GNAT superfamily N-acetyltransferase
VEISSIPADEYVRVVLPQTLPLWGGTRDLLAYADDFLSIARSAYGRPERFTVGLRAGGDIACSCKLYEREFRWGEKRLRATGIGAVFTPPQMRGRGYATALLGALLDEERNAGRDFVFLFSDIHPLFYERLGFVGLPSRNVTFAAASLDGRPTGALPIDEDDWPGVRRCFDALDARRPWSFTRTAREWNWVRRMTAPGPTATQPVGLAIKRDAEIVAYAVGRRVLRSDAFVFDDFAFNGDEGRALLPALLRAAAGDLRRISGWLPPPLARAALPRGSARRRKDAITMFAPLSADGRSWLQTFKAELFAGRADPVWPADHV